MSRLRERLEGRREMARRNGHAHSMHGAHLVAVTAQAAQLAYECAVADVAELECVHDHVTVQPVSCTMREWWSSVFLRCDACGIRIGIRSINRSTAEPEPRTRREQVTAFHKLAGQPVLDRPQVPLYTRTQLRLRLIAEEFRELLEAAYKNEESSIPNEWIGSIQSAFDNLIEYIPRVDLPAFADALADLDYVIEGTRLEFGIDGEPIAAEVQRSNMAKFPTTMDENGKIKKPPGWTPPDIAGELKRQGWEP